MVKVFPTKDTQIKGIITKDLLTLTNSTPIKAFQIIHTTVIPTANTIINNSMVVHLLKTINSAITPVYIILIFLMNL